MDLSIGFIFSDMRHESAFDMEYLYHTFNVKTLQINWEDNLATTDRGKSWFNFEEFDTLQWISDNNIKVIISTYFYTKNNNKERGEFFDKIKLHPNTQDIPIVLLHTMYPSVETKEKEEKIRNGFIYLTDFATNYFDNCIEIPLLGVLNFDTINFPQTTHGVEKKFLSSQFEDMYQREYDIKFKIGKPKPVRVLTALMLLKHNLNNLYTNVSYSNEISDCGTYDDVMDDLHLELDSEIIDKYELSNYFDKIKIESYLGAINGKTKIKYNTEQRPNIGYTADFSAYSEVYTESETCNLKKIKEYPKLTAFTEKSFTTFFYFKIPLAVDTKYNIDYLTQIGFKFPIKPCVINSYDTLDSLAKKLEEWCVYLKTFDFEELWNKWYYAPSLKDSPIRQNHHLICELMNYMSENQQGMSIPQYQSTYKFIEKIFPNKLEDYKNWDNPKYRFLTKRGLL